MKLYMTGVGLAVVRLTVGLRVGLRVGLLVGLRVGLRVERVPHETSSTIAREPPKGSAAALVTIAFLT